MSSFHRARAALWLGRGVLFIVTVIFSVIAWKFVFDPAGQAAQRGIVASSGPAITVIRVGFGAFPLACGIVTAVCLAAAQRVRVGLWFVTAVLGTVLLVRVAGAVVDRSFAASAPLIVPEAIFLTLAVFVLGVGARPAAPAVTQDGIPAFHRDG